MKYYAVTDDPNELMHFGIKGMKWGVRRTDAQLGHPRHTGSKRPRSIAYKKASSKLSKMMRNGIQKAKANWNVYNSPEAKYERQTNRAIQKARKGKLKYGKLSDDQVYRITERLSLERQARQLSDSEQTFRHRLAKSIGEGVVTGVGSGVGRVVSEKISRKSVLKTDRKRIEQQHELDRRHQRQQLRWDRQDAKQVAQNRANAEYYEAAAKRGYSPSASALRAGKIPRLQTSRERARQLRAWNERDNREAERAKRQNTYYDTYVRAAATSRAKKRIPDGSSSSGSGSSGNGQKNPQLPVTININTGSGSSRLPGTTSGTVATRPATRKRKGRR